MQTTELVEVKYDAYQNGKLEDSFRDFYRLERVPGIRKILVVDKAAYNRFLKSRTRTRTQFEAAPSEIDLTFSEITVPFEFIATKTEFEMPSGKVLTLYEELTEPCGLTKLVTATFCDNKLEFTSYFQAEGYALAKFLEEIR